MHKTATILSIIQILFYWILFFFFFFLFSAYRVMIYRMGIVISVASLGYISSHISRTLTKGRMEKLAWNLLCTTNVLFYMSSRFAVSSLLSRFTWPWPFAVALPGRGDQAASHISYVIFCRYLNLAEFYCSKII